jgi:GrpB-like predicted nucleotidyltransferase (UPF0157 family)
MFHECYAYDASGTNIDLHVFTQGSEEIRKTLLFRDWLRTNEADRELYACSKGDLVVRKWKYVQNYADAKTEVIEGILRRPNASVNGRVSRR